MSSSSEQPAKATQWLSKRHTRWQDANHPMPPMRQKQLVEEFLAELPPLPYQCPRQTQVANLQHTEARDQRIQLAPSASMPSLTAAYLGQVPRTINARGRVVDYKGWILTAGEYQRFGYAVHTAVHLAPRLFPSDTSDSTYVLLGDPTMPASQINCVAGTSKRPNAQLTVNSKELKWSAADNSKDGHRTACITNSYITVRATKALHAGEELWINYGREYWEHMSLYCPHCLEYGADRHNRMLICEAPGCKRAWHQLCLRPCLVEVPKGAFYCDIHANAN